MKAYDGTFSLETSKRLEIMNVTDKVNDIARNSGIECGLVNVWISHTTAAIMVNEDDSSLWEDILSTLSRLIPVESNYRYNLRYRGFSGEQNAHAHILNCLIKPDTTVPLKDGEMMLGTWQSILFAEFDGPRKRHVNVQVVGE